ncbi:MAG: sigma-54 dependent transcriptional regulator [Myxococcota bacterium]|nr:sigma-54 dependent transcriptional regulator [Myxococcota bacterium]
MTGSSGSKDAEKSASEPTMGEVYERQNNLSTEPLHFAHLHVVRTLREYLFERYGITLALLTKTGEVHWIAPNEMKPDHMSLPKVLDAISDSREHLESLQTIASARAGRVMTHSTGFRTLVAPCRIHGRAGRLVAWPFFTREEQRLSLADYLLQCEIPPQHVQRFTASIEVIENAGLTTIAELLALITSEIERYALEIERAGSRLRDLRSKGRSRYRRIIGTSRPMLRLYRMLDRISTTDSTVYIRGENGTGKELVAAEIHQHSRRATRPFIVQNCSALNDNLLESELFGHRIGAFTGAIRNKPGLFERADTGTFFLDEIGDMSPALQVKLLRVLQEGTFTPVGDNHVRKVDVRVLCATNRDLKAMVDEGSFREDLYYRINVITVTVPPLRERSEDIPLLIDYFLQRAQVQMGNPHTPKRLSNASIDLLRHYEWPGNVRELENEIERIVVMAGPLVTKIAPQLLSPHIRMRPLLSPPKARKALSLPQAIEKLERSMILDELTAQGWNKTRAAKALGISRRNLIRKCALYDFDQDASDR